MINRLLSESKQNQRMFDNPLNYGSLFLKFFHTYCILYLLMERKKLLRNCSDTLARSFLDQPQFTSMLPLDPSTHYRKLYAFFHLLTKYCDRFHGVIHTAEFEGVILFLPPANRKITTGRLLQAGAIGAVFKMGFKFTKAILQRMSHSKDLTTRIAKEPHIKPLMFGVKPEKRGLGFGKELIKQFWNYAEQYHLPIFIETNSASSRELYQYIGAQVQDKINNEFPTYGMMYYPDKEKDRREHLIQKHLGTPTNKRESDQNSDRTDDQ